MNGSGEHSLVLLKAEAGVATLTLNRPHKRNALSAAMVAALSRRLAEVAGDTEVRAVALRSAGGDFCAGADLAEIAASQGKGVEAGLADARKLGEVFIGIRRIEKPVAAVVRGRALGGGCGLATACDIVLAHPGASFGYPEVHLGFVPAVVMAVLRRKVGEAAAFELAARGHRVDAERAVALGLATRVIPSEDFDTAVDTYLRDLAARPPTAIALTKRLFHGFDDAAFEDDVARGAEVNAIARLTRECRDGVGDFLRGRGS